MEDCDQADGGTIKRDEPDGEDLEDCEVDEIGLLIMDCNGAVVSAGPGENR